jgi:hypothetical protein
VYRFLDEMISPKRVESSSFSWDDPNEGIYNCSTADPYYDFKQTMNSIDAKIAICENPITL